MGAAVFVVLVVAAGGERKFTATCAGALLYFFSPSSLLPLGINLAGGTVIEMLGDPAAVCL
jgi:hypothetical protein